MTAHELAQTLARIIFGGAHLCHKRLRINVSIRRFVGDDMGSGGIPLGMRTPAATQTRPSCR